MLKNSIKIGIFKRYDIRGKYPEEIDEKVVKKIVLTLGSRFKNKIVVVGRDARLSSPRLYKVAVKTLCDSKYNLKVVEVGLLTTPMLYFLVNALKADLGFMITASHNPKNYNGLKIVKKNAEPVSGTEIKRLVIGK